MAVEKSPYLRGPAPIPMEEEPLDIQVVDDVETGVDGLPKNVMPTEDGGVIVDISGRDLTQPDSKNVPFDANLAEHMDETDLRTLASDLITDFEDDKRSRADWEKKYKDGLRLLGLNIEKPVEPWNGACGVVHPIMAEAVVRFQAELMTETFPPHGPVKTKLLGARTPQKEEAEIRVREDMNIELTDRMTEYRAEHERLLWNLPAAGCALKKIYFDPTLKRQCSMFVSAEDFVVSYGASDLATCPRYTQIIKKTPNDLKKLMVSKFYRTVELSEPIKNQDDVTEEKDKIAGQVTVTKIEHHTLLEMSVDLHLNGFEDPLGIALPYIVTIEKDSLTVLGIRRNWDERDEKRLKKQHFVKYGYIPGFGFYDFGLIHLVGGFAESATSILRQLVDAGTLSNLPGGLKTRGLRIKGDDTPIGPGEWRDVDVPGGTLKENLMPIPYKEPSAVLAQLLEKIVEEGRKFAAVAEMKVADFDSNSPVGTTMALLERTLKVMSAVQARIYESMKHEFRLIKNLIRDHGTDVYEYDPEIGTKEMKGQDYDAVDVLPVADPNAATMSQRIVQWQAVMQLVATAPQIYDLPEVHGEMLTILGVKNATKMIPTWKANQQPTDPVSENMAIINGKPVKAFIHQDHESHIAVHQMAMQDPKVMQMVGQNPMAPQIQAAAMAHLMEHLAFSYRAQMEQMMGVPLPPPDQPLPPEMEVQLSRLLVQAQQKLLNKHQNEAAQQAAQAAAQDPVLAQQMREADIKEREVERKALRDADDVRLKEEELRIKEMDVMLDAQAKGAQIGQQAIMHSDKIKADMQKQDKQLGSTERTTGFKAAIDLTKQDRDREDKDKDRAVGSADKLADRFQKDRHKAADVVDKDKDRERDRERETSENLNREADREQAAKQAQQKPKKE